MTTSTPEPPADAPIPRRRRGTAIDMVRSLGLVALGVAALMLFTLRDQPDRTPVTVDITATVEAARADAGYPVLAVTALPPGWYANFAEYEAVAGEPGHDAFHIGYITADEQYFAVDASNASDQRTLADEARTGKPVRTETLAEIVFEVYASDEGETWFHAGGDTEPYSITLTGTGSADQWLAFTSALATTGPAAAQ